MIEFNNFLREVTAKQVADEANKYFQYRIKINQPLSNDDKGKAIAIKKAKEKLKIPIDAFLKKEIDDGTLRTGNSSIL